METADGATQDGAPGDLGGPRSAMSGAARDVVQARDINGGLNILQGGRRSLPEPRQLPGDVRGFVGRERDLEWLDRLLAGGGVHPNAVGVSVISGTAGVGKTTLAVHWAHRVRHRFPDGQLYVDLRGYAPGTPECAPVVLDRLLRALDIPNAAVPAGLAAKAPLYRSPLADRRTRRGPA